MPPYSAITCRAVSDSNPAAATSDATSTLPRPSTIIVSKNFRLVDEPFQKLRFVH